MKNMKFDIIIGNPPYQEKDGGYGASAKPIYNLFIEDAIKLKPKYISMIVPARWFTGGKGLAKFRKMMLNNDSIKYIKFFNNSKECFEYVDITGGICYFLIDSKYNGDCLFDNGGGIIKRKLNMYSDFFITDNKSIGILEKINNKNNLSNFLYSISSFGLPTNFNKGCLIKNNELNIKVYATKKILYTSVDNVIRNKELLNKYKVLVSQAYGGSINKPFNIIGKPIIAKPNEICTATYIVAGHFDNEKEAINYSKYLKTKFVRYLIGLLKNTQNFSKSNAYFVPMQDFNLEWNDEKLYSKYKLTQDEIQHIESMIRPMK